MDCWRFIGAFLNKPRIEIMPEGGCVNGKGAPNDRDHPLSSIHLENSKRYVNISLDAAEVFLRK